MFPNRNETMTQNPDNDCYYKDAVPPKEESASIETINSATYVEEVQLISHLRHGIPVSSTPFDGNKRLLSEKSESGQGAFAEDIRSAVREMQDGLDKLLKVAELLDSSAKSCMVHGFGPRNCQKNLKIPKPESARMLIERQPWTKNKRPKLLSRGANMTGPSIRPTEITKTLTTPLRRGPRGMICKGRLPADNRYRKALSHVGKKMISKNYEGWAPGEDARNAFELDLAAYNWENQGKTWKQRVFNGRPLDNYKVFCEVLRLGGCEAVVEALGMSYVVKRLELGGNTSLGSTLKTIYLADLYHYEQGFVNGTVPSEQEIEALRQNSYDFRSERIYRKADLTGSTGVRCHASRVLSDRGL